MNFSRLPVAKSNLQKPLLIIPCNQEDDDYTSTSERCLLSLSDEKLYKFKENVFKGLDDAWWVGSSYGWLVILDEKARPLLLNPFSGDRIRLPLIPKAFRQCGSESYFVEQLRKNFIARAVLQFSPSTSIFSAVIIYGCNYKLAYCSYAENRWTNLAGAKRAYMDIIFCNVKLYALAVNGSVEVWDFRGNLPMKILDIEPSFAIEEEKNINFPIDKFSTQFYLVELKGEILLVKRIVGNFVNAGKAVYETDLLTDEDTQPLVCPYRTMHFNLYKLDFKRIKWEKLNSLNDQILFLGGNHSISMSAQDLPNFEANSIHFTDNRWDEMNEDYLYGGHDLDVFNFEYGSIKPLYVCEMDRIYLPPLLAVLHSILN
ncbi:F-box domain containing protein [Quillaja saponaria]|uniref:F-box domain containing protein n=1 Tax=Quillaja saponaria TaxID=32244 RepID=A0AAD7LIS9_QUISA|nr:F-box domain containing protein [Quillaja saponaria]